MSRITPEDADRIFSARVDKGDLQLGDLAAFVRDVRDVYTRAPDAATQARHLRAMAEAFAGTRPTPVRRARRRLVRRAAAAAFAGTFLIGGTALAATGNLPAPAQNAVSDAVEFVGVKIPKAQKASPTGQEQGDAGKARATENRERAKAFTDAKKAWTECVAAKAPQSGGSFDPEAPAPEGCGPKPDAQDFKPARENPAGHENRGKGAEPKGRPDEVGPRSREHPGNGRGPSPSPTTAPGNSGSVPHGQGNGPPEGRGNAGR